MAKSDLNVSDVLRPASAGLLGSGGAAAMLPAGWAPWAPLLLILGLVAGALTLATWKGIQGANATLKRAGAAGISLVLLGVGFAGVLDGAPTAPPPGQCNPAIQYCGPPIPPLSVSITIPTTPLGSDTDGAAEIFDSEGFDGDQESPLPTICAYSGTITALADRMALEFRHRVSVDNDVVRTAATFAAPDICAVDWQITFTPRDLDGVSGDDSVTFFMRVRAKTPYTKDANESGPSLNYQWDTFGTYIGGTRIRDTQTTASVWWTGWDGSQSPGGRVPANTWSEYKSVGSSTGANADFFTTAYVLRNNGIFRYTQESDSYEENIEWELSGPDRVPLAVLRAEISLTVRD